MSKRKKNDLAMPVSWRNLKPVLSRKTSSKVALRKRWSMVGRLFVGGCIVIGSVLFLVLQANKESPSQVGQSDYTGPALAVDQIIFQSNGVLSQRWFINWLGPLRGLSLAEINLEKLQTSLLEEQQITAVKVSRKFPSSLVVRVKECEPLLVLRLREGKTGFKDWLISADGTLYPGVGYSRGMLKLLPSLKIPASLLKKHSDAKGYQKLEAIPYIAPLLELARAEYPQIHRDWRVVSYNRPDERGPGANISIQSKRIGSIRFSPSGYADQLKRLQYLLEEPKFSQASYIHSIDLSLGRSVFAKI